MNLIIAEGKVLNVLLKILIFVPSASTKLENIISPPHVVGKTTLSFPGDRIKSRAYYYDY